MVEDTSHMPMCNGSMLRWATRSLLFPGVWSTVPLLAGWVWRFEVRCVAELPVCGGAAATGSGEPPAVVAQGVATLSRKKHVMPIGVPHPGGAAGHPRGGGGQRTRCWLALVLVGPVARMCIAAGRVLGAVLVSVWSVLLLRSGVSVVVGAVLLRSGMNRPAVRVCIATPALHGAGQRPVSVGHGGGTLDAGGPHSMRRSGSSCHAVVSCARVDRST